MTSDSFSTASLARLTSRGAAALVSLAATTVVHAANATWNGSIDSIWATSANWSATPVPGAGDTATFSNAGGFDDVIDLGAGVTLRSLVFDSAAAGPYIIGTGDAGSQTLTLESSGGIALNATVPVDQDIQARLALGTGVGAGAFTFTNSRTAATQTLFLSGGLTAATAGVKTATFAGSGNIRVSGPVADGSGTLALAKTGAHTLTLAGENSYSGGTTVTGVVVAATNTALGSGGVTINSGAGNQLQLGAGVAVTNPLVVNGGGVVAQGVLYVPAGGATFGGTLQVNAAPNAGGLFATAGTGELVISGDNSVSTTVPVSIRTGMVAFTGTQNYATGTNLANAGATVRFGKPTSMPASGTVTLVSGTTLVANVGSTGGFTLGAGTTTAGTVGGLIGGIGGQGAPVVLPAGSQVGIDTTGATTTQTWNAPFASANNPGLIKLGPGTLALSSGGTYVGGGASGFPLVARQGTLLLNGGAHVVTGEAVIGGTFGRANGDSGLDAVLQVDSGSLTTSSWLSLGRGNGVGVASSDLIANNDAAILAANFSAGFNGGNAANLPKGSITLNGSSTLTISENGAFQLAESTGSVMTLDVNDSASLIAAGTGGKFFGMGGLGTVNLADSGSIQTGTGIAYIGYQSGTGVFNQSGGTLTTGGQLRVGGSATSGTAPNGTGRYEMTGGVANLESLAVGRGNNNQNTVSGEVLIDTGATMTVTNDVVLGFAGGANLGKLTLNGGTLNVGPSATKWLVMSQYDTTNSELNIDGGRLNLNNSSSIKLFTGNASTSGQAVIRQTGGEIVFHSDGGTAPGGTGNLDLAYSGSATASSTLHLDGGSLTVPAIVSTSSTPTRTLNFNGGLLRAAGNSTNFLALGSGNVRANVRDGGARIDTAGHAVEISRALDHSDIEGDAELDGGLVKSGAGSLKLSGSNTYTGPTLVQAGTLDFTGSTSSDITVAAGATLSGNGITEGEIDFEAGSTFAATTSGVPMVAAGVHFNGPVNLVYTGIPSNGTQYQLVQYGAGGASGLANLTSSFRTVVSNDTANSMIVGTVTTAELTWNSTNGTWEKGVAGWSGAFPSYFNGDSVTFGERPTASTITLNGTLTPGLVSVTNTTNPYVFTGSGMIAGEASLIKSGAGALTLATANTYTGGTILEGGRLNLAHPSALGTGLLILSGGSIDNASGAPLVMTGNVPQNWEEDVVFAGTHALDLGMGPVSLGGDGEIRTVQVGANTLSVGKITSSFHGLVKSGPGTLEVGNVGAGNAASLIFGPLRIDAGTVAINRAGAVAATSGDFTAGGLTGTGTLTNGAEAARWFFSNPSSGSFDFSGTLANGGIGGLGFNKSGAGTQILSGALSYTDVTTVAGGELILSGTNSGTGSNANLTGGTLTLASPSALGTTSLIRFNGTNVASLNLATDADSNVYPIAMGTTTEATIVSNRATDGPGITHTLTTQSAANGLGGGTLHLVRGGRVTSGTARIAFTQLGLGAGTVQTTRLVPVDVQVTVGDINKQNNDVAQTIDLGGSTTGNEVTGVISNGTPLTGTNTISLAKSGTSTWTLTGTNTYTGTTTIGGGVLVIAGNHTGAPGEVQVNEGGTLAGAGDLGGAVTVNAGGTDRIAVAATPGAQDPRAIAGTLTYNFTSALVVTAASQPADGTYVLATAAGIPSLPTTITYSGVTNGTVSISGNSLVLTVGSGGTGSGYAGWASASGLTAGVNDLPDQDADNDGYDNRTEYLLGGAPLNGSSRPRIHALLADTSADDDNLRELVVTIAVPQGTPAFPMGSPRSTVAADGGSITVRGTTDLTTFPVQVTPVDRVTTGLPTLTPQGGVSYEYRSFRLEGSNGIGGKGFLQVLVTP